MKSAIYWSALAGIIATPLAAQNIEPLPPEGQPAQTPAPTTQPAQTTNPPLPGQTAPRPYPAPTSTQTRPLDQPATPQTTQQQPVPSAPVQQQPVQQQSVQPQPTQLPYEATGDQVQPGFQQPAQSYAPPPPPPPPSYKPSDFTTIVDILDQSPTHTRLAQLVQQAGLASALEENGPFTIFAPSNAAFMTMEEGELADLLKPENRATLDRLLKYHVIKGYLAGSELDKQLKRNGGRGSLPTLAGQTLIAGYNEAGQITLTDPKGHVGTITSYDTTAFNGLVHVTDMVMVPAEPEDPNAKKKRRR